MPTLYMQDAAGQTWMCTPRIDRAAILSGPTSVSLLGDNRARPEVSLFVNAVLVTYRFAPGALNMQRDTAALAGTVSRSPGVETRQH